MIDLVEFLQARLAEDEAVARQSADFGGGINGYHWRVSGSHEDEGGTYWRITATAVASGHEQAIEVVGSGMSGGGVHTEQVAHHAVRHDPARVLRGVAAKRTAVDEAAYWLDKVQANEPNPMPSLADRVVVARSMLCALAAEWSDHPDYDPGWVGSL